MARPENAADGVDQISWTANGSENSAPAAANRPIRARKLTLWPTRFCNSVYPAQPSIASSASRSPVDRPVPTEACPLVMIKSAPASAIAMPMICRQPMDSRPVATENSSTTIGASAMISARLMADVVIPAT